MNSSMENASNSTNEMRLSYSVFLTDILFQSQNESLDIGSIIGSALTFSYMQINGTVASNGACSYWDPDKGIVLNSLIIEQK